MLKLIGHNSLEVVLYILNLNTSHVKVNLLEYCILFLLLLYLNTSHVKVNHIKNGVNKIVDYNLNTSHVKVNPCYFLKSCAWGTLFKYISC